MTKLKIYKTQDLSNQGYTCYQLILVANDKWDAIEAFNEFILNDNTYNKYFKLDKVTEKNIKEYDIGKISRFVVDP